MMMYFLKFIEIILLTMIAFFAFFFFLQFVKTLKKYLKLSLLLEDDTRFHCRNTENIDILKRST